MNFNFILASSIVGYDMTEQQTAQSESILSSEVIGSEYWL